MVSLVDLAVVFLKIGALGFGGPFALLALMENEVVQKRRWLSPEDFAESAAIGALTPGPIFFAAATHAGYRLRGVAGAIVTASACLLPAFVSAIVLAALYVRIQALPAVIGATKGLAAGVIALLAVMTFRSGRSLVTNLAGILLAVGSFLGLTLAKLNPAWVILATGLVGAIVYHPKEG